MRRYYNVLSQTLLAHGPEAQDATERDDGALHARKGPMNEGQVEGYQGGIWAQVVEGDELRPFDPDITDLLIAHREG